MPTDLHAIRDCVELRDKESHRLVAFAALDDITNRSRPRFQWSHQHLSRQLGVSPAFTSMVGNYLDYRKNLRKISAERGIRPWGAKGAQLFVYDDRLTTLDLLNLGTSGERTAQMAKLLMEATARKVRVEAETTQNIERMLGRACGMSWETIQNTFRRQQSAQIIPVPTLRTATIQAATTTEAHAA